MTACDICGEPAQGEVEYSDGEIVVGCPDCLLEIVADPRKPVEVITEYENTNGRDRL